MVRTTYPVMFGLPAAFLTCTVLVACGAAGDLRSGQAPAPVPQPAPAGSLSLPGPQGLSAEYFDRQDFTTSRLKRTEQLVDFDWGAGSPDPSIAPNTFSARYSGELLAPTSGTYTFYVTADDGVRLSLNGQRVVDDFSDHAARTSTGTLNLSAGQRVPLLLEYYENTGQASLKLEWSGPGVTRQVIPASALSGSASISGGQTYYVAPGGKDGGPGSEAQPWGTLNWAAQTLNPGDTVLVKDGTYPGVYLNRSGAPGQLITFRAAPGAKPRIVITEINSPGFLLEGVSYIDIAGFDLDYQVPGVENAGGKRWEGGITIKANEYGATPVPSHHVRVTGNRVRGFPGGGIGSGQADYITIEGNTIWETALWSEYDTSAISLYQSRDVDTAPGFHNVIRANTVFRNENRVPGTGIGNTVITDGNCIIIDDGRNTQKFQQDQRPYPAYRASTLIENNLCADNGGRGVNVFSSDNVLIRHNTLWQNGRTPGLDGEISVLAASNVRVVNNIMVPRSGQPATSVYDGDVAALKVSTVVFGNNLYWNTDQVPQRTPTVQVQGDRVGDPQFVAPGSDLNTANFRLKPGSPAIDAALASDSPDTDIGGLSRPVGTGPDIGAWEAR